MAPHEEITDEEWARRMFEGDERAARVLLTRYHRPLFGTLYRLCRDAAEAEDLFQEAFLRVLNASQKFDATRRFKPWLFKIAINLWRDRARRLRHRANPRLTADGELPESADFEIESAWSDKLDIRRSLDNLPAPSKEVLLLRYYEGMTEPEIAAAVGIPRGTVKSRLHRAIGMLRNDLQEAASE